MNFNSYRILVLIVKLQLKISREDITRDRMVFKDAGRCPPTQKPTQKLKI